DGNPKREFGHAHSRANVLAGLWPVELQDQIREAIDDDRLLAESRRRIDHPEYTKPGGHAIQVTELTLKTSKHGERSEPGRRIGSLRCDVTPDLAKRCREASVRLLRSVA